MDIKEEIRQECFSKEKIKKLKKGKVSKFIGFETKLIFKHI